MNDSALLADIPEQITIGGLLKATASEERGQRYLYIEASNEGDDYENEVVLQKALADSSDYFLRHGNVDLEHFTLTGRPDGSKPMADYLSYEIGKPVEVAMAGKTTFVKAIVYKGESPQGKNGEMVWASMTKQSPPCRWYPSVGGGVMAKSVRIDPTTGIRRGVIEKVRWNNIGLTRTPVNKTVPEASTSPIGVFAKSLGAFVMAKTLTAGYGTDSASLTGGSSLREQSLWGAPINYFDWRNRVSKNIRDGKVGPKPGARELVAHSMNEFLMPTHEASEHVERFLNDLHAGMNKRSKAT